jgi:hypothetical protein
MLTALTLYRFFTALGQSQMSPQPEMTNPLTHRPKNTDAIPT